VIDKFAIVTLPETMANGLYKLLPLMITPGEPLASMVTVFAANTLRGGSGLVKVIVCPPVSGF
jgi:hypothetical protein